jgi:hypothetical protein
MLERGRQAWRQAPVCHSDRFASGSRLFQPRVARRRQNLERGCAGPVTVPMSLDRLPAIDGDGQRRAASRSGMNETAEGMDDRPGACCRYLPGR